MLLQNWGLLLWQVRRCDEPWRGRLRAAAQAERNVPHQTEC